MSYTELLATDEHNDFRQVAHYRNAHGFAPFVWEALCARYNLAGYIPPDSWSLLFSWTKTPENMARLAPWEQNVLRATFDRAVIYEEDIATLASSFDQFAMFHNRGNTRVCHLHEMATDLRKLHATAVGFYATSVCDNLFQIHVNDTERRAYNLEDGAQYGHGTVKMVPWPVEPDVERFADMRRLLSQISERMSCAGWKSGIENTVWNMLVGDPTASELTGRETTELNKLVAELGHWPIWDDARSMVVPLSLGAWYHHRRTAV